MPCWCSSPATTAPTRRSCTSARSPVATPTSSSPTPATASSGSARVRPSRTSRPSSGVTGRHIDEFADAVVKDSGEVTVRMVRDADRDLTRELDAARSSEATDAGGAHRGRRRARPLPVHLRLTKDEWEVEEMRKAVEATHHGFEAVIADLPEAAGQGPRRALGRGRLRPHRAARGQRRRLRLDLRRRRPRHHAALDQEHRRAARRRPHPARRRRRGGVAVHRRHHPHAPRRTAPSPTRSARSTTPCMPRRRPGSPRSSRATSSPTSTPPRSGSSPSTCTRGGCCPKASPSRTPSTRTTASTTAAGWCTARATTSASTCTTAPWRPARSTWTPSCEPGMVLTVEPGLYFKADDLKAPERFRGIGVRIEDDVLVTADGCENLSAAMPRTSADVEAVDPRGPVPLRRSVSGGRRRRGSAASARHRGLTTPAEDHADQLGRLGERVGQGVVVGLVRLQGRHRRSKCSPDLDEVRGGR